LKSFIKFIDIQKIIQVVERDGAQDLKFKYCATSLKIKNNFLTWM